MIQQSFASTRPRNKWQYTPVALVPANGLRRVPSPQDRARAYAMKITPEEFVRRDDIIKVAFDACTHKAGDIVIPINAKDFKEYGELRVRGIVKSYFEFSPSDNEWDAGDHAYILTLEQVNKSPVEVVHATPGWAKKKP